MIVHDGHTNRVWSVVFSPDGKSVISGSEDRTVRMWNVDRSSPIGEPLMGHNGYIYSVPHAPLGNLIASGSDDGTIRLWDTNTRQQSGEALKGEVPFWSVAFSLDAKLIVSGSAGSSSSSAGFAVQLWNVQTRKTVSAPFKGHTNYVWSVSFASDSSRVLSGSFDQTIRVWDVERGATIIGPLKGHTSYVRSTAFSRDDTQILSCSEDGTIRFWDARTGGTIGEPYTGHTGAVHAAAFSPCGTYVVTGGSDKTVRLWDTRTGRQVDQPFNEHTGPVRSVAYSPCGQYIASGSDDSKVIIRKVRSEEAIPENNTQPEIVTSQMSTQHMFECLRDAGCIDLSSQMDSSQETLTKMSRGVFGDIWQGRLDSCAQVAIKAWRPNPLEQCDDKIFKRAAHEIFDLSKMEHPNVHRLQGVIMFRDQYLGMVSEWMDDGNIYEYLVKRPVADRYRLCAQVASGLDYIHFCGKVHGDLKAVNVLVSSDGVAKISHLDSSVMSEIKSLVFLANSNPWPGAFRWTAPEILSEEVQQKTTQTDIYALGMTMIEILTGQAPYPDCRSDISVIKTVERGTLPTRPTQLGSDHKGDKMWQLLVRCWSRSPRERPSSGYMAGALDHI